MRKNGGCGLFWCCAGICRWCIVILVFWDGYWG